MIAPGVCGVRPTFKGTRVEVQTILDSLADAWNVAEILKGYPALSQSAIEEAIRLAAQALANERPLQAA